MIRKINCQNCNKGLYATDFDVYGPCPYCGFVFNWKLSDDAELRKKNKNATETPKGPFKKAFNHK